MTYTEFDQSKQSALAIHLFEFIYEGTTYRFTDLARDYTALSQTWTSAGLITGNIVLSNELNRDLLSIKLPKSNTFAALLLNSIQNVNATLNIFRGYRDDPDEEFITYWKGRIISVKVEVNTISIDCEPITTALRRPGLRARYTLNCRHTHYGRGCGLDPDSSSFVVETTLDSITDLTLTISDAASYSDGYFSAGMVAAPTGEFRFIKSHIGSQIVITKAHSGLVASAAIRLYPGCDLTPSTCLNKFNNLDNFGGFPWIPTKNPYGGTSVI